MRHLGDERVDPWFWLRERDDPAVLAYLEAENEYTDTSLAHSGQLRDDLYAEIVGRVRQTDASAPVRRGPFEYFTRTIEGQQYDVHCRRAAGTPGLPDADVAPGGTPGETVLLDENELARGHDYFVGDLEPNPAQTVAYTTDTTGERYDLRFRSPDTGVDLDDTARRVLRTPGERRSNRVSRGPTTPCARGRCGDTPRHRPADVLVTRKTMNASCVRRSLTGRLLSLCIQDHDEVRSPTPTTSAEPRCRAAAQSRGPSGAPRRT